MAKQKNVWAAQYNGHTIVVVNELKSKLIIDGEVVDTEKGLINLSYTLHGTLPDTGEDVVVTLTGAEGLTAKCHMTIGKRADVQQYLIDGDKATPISESETEKQASDALTMAVVNIINVL